MQKNLHRSTEKLSCLWYFRSKTAKIKCACSKVLIKRCIPLRAGEWFSGLSTYITSAQPVNCIRKIVSMCATKFLSACRSSLMNCLEDTGKFVYMSAQTKFDASMGTITRLKLKRAAKVCSCSFVHEKSSVLLIILHRTILIQTESARGVYWLPAPTEKKVLS